MKSNNFEDLIFCLQKKKNLQNYTEKKIQTYILNRLRPEGAKIGISLNWTN